MLTSQKIARRQSEIREKLAHLAGIESPTMEQRSELTTLDAEYTTNEQRYRAALIGATELGRRWRRGRGFSLRSADGCADDPQADGRSRPA